MKGEEGEEEEEGSTIVGPPGSAIRLDAAAHPFARNARSLERRGLEARQNDAPAMIASRAGDYIVQGFLAEGGFGVVVRGAHATRGTAAAIKILRHEMVPHLRVLLRFEREVEAIRRIRHPGVVEIFDFGWLPDGRPYFAMELLAGDTLAQHLHARGRLPIEEALAILEPLCSALEAAHEQGVVHRDIKPSNVFLCSGDRRVVLLDFGIAKLLDAQEAMLTSSKEVVGTPAFTSPEQLLNQPVDERTDIYALGALLFTMLTGVRPFHESTHAALRQLHLHSLPPRPSARAPLSPAFDGVILRAMSKDRAARQPDVGAFLAEVHAAAAQVLREGAHPVGLHGRRALGLHVEVLADASALEAPSELVLADFESILPRAVGELSAAGFAPAVEAGTSVLLTAPWPTDARGSEQAQRAAVSAAVSLHLRLLTRPGRDPRVRVRLCLNAGEVMATDDGALIGGDLLDLSAWVPEEALEGVYASPAVLANLDFPTQPGAPAANGTVPLLRLLDL